MRRATASVQLRTQVDLVCLKVISAKIHSKCASQPKIAKKITKTYFAVQGRSRSSTLVPPEIWSAVLVTISSKSVSTCNRFHARRANNGEEGFLRGTPV